MSGNELMVLDVQRVRAERVRERITETNKQKKSDDDLGKEIENFLFAMVIGLSIVFIVLVLVIGFIIIFPKLL